MNCKSCKLPYSLTDQKKLPRVLTACGHTFCHNCINNQIKSNNIIYCLQCQTPNQRSSQNFPVNETLRIILSNYQKQQFCQLHGKKLQAYCQKDNQLLCLNCVLTTHKAHKVSSISQKVQRDKQILKSSFARIQKNKKQYQAKLSQCEKYIQNIAVHYNDYLLDLSLMYKKIINQIKSQEQKAFQKAKLLFEKQIQKIKIIQEQVKQKIQFCASLSTVFNNLMAMDDIPYLNEDNQRIFIVQNTTLKNFKISNSKIQFNKTNLLQSLTSFIQQILYTEKYKYKTDKKQNSQLKQSIVLGGSPSFNKKNSIRQPQILQVNLSEQYQKHQMIKNKSKIQTNRNALNEKDKRQIKASKQTKQTKFANNKKINNSKQFTISVFSEEEFFENKDSFQLQNGNFANLTPLSIKSFMNSSQQSILKDSFSLKDSKSQFTIMEKQQYVYHFGGFGNNTIEKTKLNSQLIGTHFISTKLDRPNINRSKCQTVILKTYSESKSFILGGKNQQGERLSSILEFNLQTNVIQQSQFKLSEPKSGFGAIVKNQKIYIVGGSSNSSLNTLEQYWINSFKLCHNKLAPMINSRDQLGFTLGLDGFLYVAGGINNSNLILNSCERYCFKKNKWTSISSMKTSRRSFSLISLPNAIFAIGGHDGKQPLSSVQMLQYDNISWIPVTDLQKARFTHTSIYTKDFQNIIVFGGYEQAPLKSIQVYNVLQNKWSYGGDLEQSRFLHCSLFLSQKVNSTY